MTVIVPTKNEVENIVDCLATLTWADQVYIVDSDSTDGTIQVAKASGADVIQFDYNGNWPKKKNWSLRNLDIRNDWIFIVDADERVTDELKAEITAAIRRPDVFGYYMRWKFMFLGRWMKHSWSQGWMLRLFRKGFGEYEDLGMRGEGGWDNEVHENIRVTGRTACMQGYLLHESNKSIEFWIKKQNEFSSWNAIRRSKGADEYSRLRDLFSSDPLTRRRTLKGFFLLMPLKPVLTFIYLYFIRLGFLDGRQGLYFCGLRAWHELATNVKLFEIRQSRVSARKRGS